MIEVQFTYYQEDKWIVAYCEELKISSYGNTQEEATNNLLEAILILLEELRDRGKLDDLELWDNFCKVFQSYHQNKLIQEMGGIDKIFQDYLNKHKD